MQGGETWQKYYEMVKRALLKRVIQRGDTAQWEGRVEGEREVGAIYTTAVNTMILAMPYHYLPLYQR